MISFVDGAAEQHKKGRRGGKSASGHMLMNPSVSDSGTIAEMTVKGSATRSARQERACSRPWRSTASTCGTSRRSSAVYGAGSRRRTRYSTARRRSAAPHRCWTPSRCRMALRTRPPSVMRPGRSASTRSTPPARRARIWRWRSRCCSRPPACSPPRIPSRRPKSRRRPRRRPPARQPTFRPSCCHRLRQRRR